MSFTNWNIPWVNRKAWQSMNPCPTASAAWSFIITDRNWLTWNALVCINATTHYWYSVIHDAFLQLPSFALWWTWGAWACGTYLPYSNTITANGWTTTTITSTTQVSNLIIWATVRFLSWTAANLWLERTITDVYNAIWGNTTITFTPALPSAVVNTDTFAMNTWRFVAMSAWTVAAWIIKTFDIATWVVTSLGTTWLPWTWWTDWKLVATPSTDWAFATWTATAWASTTITNSAKTWTTNQWCNYQIRITGGTWIGQIRTIASNTWTVITVSSAWTTTPDATSTYSIEWNDDFIYLLGNNAVTMYRYSISWGTWTTMAPTTARAAAPIAWMSANWISKTWDTTWANENNIQDWRYIYSFRWWASTLDRFDIAWGTWWAWKNITYKYAQETFSTWSSYDVVWSKIYIQKDTTNRFFRFDVVWNDVYPFSTLLQTNWTAVLWDKIFTWRYVDPTNPNNYIDWLYTLSNTWTQLFRVMIID